MPTVMPSGYKPRSAAGKVLAKRGQQERERFAGNVDVKTGVNQDFKPGDAERKEFRTSISKALDSDRLSSELPEATLHKSKVKGLSDDFKDTVLDPAKKVSKRWKAYQKDEASGWKGKKPRDVAASHEDMIRGFEALRINAQNWLDTKGRYGDKKHTEKRRYCEEIIETAQKGIKEILSTKLDTLAADDAAGREKTTERLQRVVQDENIKINRKAVADYISKHTLPKEALKELDLNALDPDEIAKKLNKPGLDKDFVARIIKEAKDATPDFPKGFKPVGWVKDLAFANPAYPDQARPKLKLDQAEALNVWSAEAFVVGKDEHGYDKFLEDEGQPVRPFSMINKHLIFGTKLDPALDKILPALDSAFKEAKPFPMPVPVGRVLDFFTKDGDPDEVALDKYLKDYREAYQTGKLARVSTYNSTSQTPPKGWAYNVVLQIVAKRGLDLSPYTNSTDEREMLLERDMILRIESIDSQPGPNLHEKKKGLNEQIPIWTVKAEQMLPKDEKLKASAVVNPK